MASSWWGATAPPAGVLVDRHHPLADRLQACWLADSPTCFVDRLHGHDARWSSGGGGTRQGAGPHGGPSLRFPDGTLRVVSVSDRPALRSGAIGFTWLVVYLVDDYSANRELVWKGDADFSDIDYRLDQFTGGSLRAWIGSGGVTRALSTGAGVISLGQWNTVFFWHDPLADTLGLWVNGRTFSASTSGTAPAETANPVHFGSYAGSANALVGQIALAAYWKRILGAKERSDLAAQPYQLFQAPAWRKLFVPAAAASGARLLASLGVGA